MTLTTKLVMGLTANITNCDEEISLVRRLQYSPNPLFFRWQPTTPRPSGSYLIAATAVILTPRRKNGGNE